MPSETGYRGVPVPGHLSGTGALVCTWRDGVDAALAHVASLLTQALSAEQEQWGPNERGQARTPPDACASCGAPYRKYRSMGRFCHHTSECDGPGRAT